MAADMSNNLILCLKLTMKKCSNNLILSLSKDEGIHCGAGQAVAMLPCRPG